MPAADTIEVRLRPMTDFSAERILVWAVVIVLSVIAFVISWFTSADLSGPGPSGVREVQFLRRSSGELLLRGESPPFRSKPLLMLIRRDAERLDKGAFLAKWGDPREWHRLLDHERY